MNIKKPLERMLHDARYIGTVATIVVGTTILGVESCKNPGVNNEQSQFQSPYHNHISYKKIWAELSTEEREALIPNLIIRSQDYTLLNSIMRDMTGRKDIQGEELNMFLTFVRTSLWKPLLQDVEKNYLKTYADQGWEDGLTFARIAAETGGDPLAVSKYGAAGLDQMLGGIANLYGIQTYHDNNAKGRDSLHADALIRLKKRVLPKNSEHIKESQIQYLLDLEERFNPMISASAGVKFFANMLQTFGDVDNALSGYNSNSTGQTSYINEVLQRLKEYKKLDAVYSAYIDNYIGNLIAGRLIQKPLPLKQTNAKS